MKTMRKVFPSHVVLVTIASLRLFLLYNVALLFTTPLILTSILRCYKISYIDFNRASWKYY